MTVATDVIGLYQVWTQSDTAAVEKQKKMIDSGVNKTLEHTSPIAKMISKEGNSQHPVWKWFQGFPFQMDLTATLATATLTFSGNLLGAAITADALRQHVRKYTVVERLSDGVQMLMSAAPDYSAKTVTVAAHGNTGSLSNDGAATTYRIIGQLSDDWDTTKVPQAVDRSTLWCSIQKFKRYVVIPHLKADMAMESVADEFALSLSEVITQLANEEAQSLISASPPYSGGYKSALESQNPAMTGILSWARMMYENDATRGDYLYKDMNGVAITVPDLDSLVYHMMYDEHCDFNRGKWVVAINPVQQQYIADQYAEFRTFMSFKETTIGYEVQSFHSRIGKTFPFVVDPYIPARLIAVLNMDDFKRRYYGSHGGTRVVVLQEAEEDIIQKKITRTPQGVKSSLPRQIGILRNLPLTYSS